MYDTLKLSARYCRTQLPQLPVIIGHCISQSIFYFIYPDYYHVASTSRVAQWKRAGPITQRSVDRNHSLLAFFP